MFGLSGILGYAKVILAVAALAGGGVWIWGMKSDNASLRTENAEIRDDNAMLREREAHFRHELGRRAEESRRILEEQSRAHAASVADSKAARKLELETARRIEKAREPGRRLVRSAGGGGLDRLAEAHPEAAQAALQAGVAALKECMAILSDHGRPADDGGACLESSGELIDFAPRIRGILAGDSLNKPT